MRLIFAVAAGMLLLVTTGLGGAALALHGAGTVAIEVQERGGTHVSLRLPAGAINLAVALTPSRLIDEGTGEVAEELRPFLPAMTAAVDQLARCPDAVLVEVRSRREHVRIETASGRLIVTVESDGENVRIELPMDTVRAVAEKLEHAVARA